MAGNIINEAGNVINQADNGANQTVNFLEKFFRGDFDTLKVFFIRFNFQLNC